MTSYNLKTQGPVMVGISIFGASSLLPSVTSLQFSQV